MTRRALTFTTLFCVAAVCLSAGEIGSNHPSLIISKDENEVVIEGQWKRTTSLRSVEVPDVNAFRIECSKSQRTCKEYIAKLITPADGSGIAREVLFLMREDFAVTSWGRTSIRAIAKPRAADITLAIDLPSKSATRESKETEDRGATGANTALSRWAWRQDR